MKLMNSNKKLSVRVSFTIIALSLGLIFYAYSQSAYAISMNINLGGNDYHTNHKVPKDKGNLKDSNMMMKKIVLQKPDLRKTIKII
jgi:hypothetical protein